MPEVITTAAAVAAIFAALVALFVIAFLVERYGVHVLRAAGAIVAVVISAAAWLVTFHADGMARVRAMETREHLRRPAVIIDQDGHRVR